MWKQGAAPFDKARPTYVAEPQELPNAVEAPSFQICHLHDGVLTLPRDIRSMFLQDPVRSPEWKDLLRDFDRCYGAATDSAQGAPEVTAGPAVDWSTVFPDAPQFSEDKVKAKYSFAAVQGITCYFVIPATVNPENGDENLHEFWVSATGEATIPATVPILTYGAGSWLVRRPPRSSFGSFVIAMLHACWRTGAGLFQPHCLNSVEARAENIRRVMPTLGR